MKNQPKHMKNDWMKNDSNHHRFDLKTPTTKSLRRKMIQIFLFFTKNYLNCAVRDKYNRRKNDSNHIALNKK